MSNDTRMMWIFLCAIYGGVAIGLIIFAATDQRIGIWMMGLAAAVCALIALAPWERKP